MRIKSNTLLIMLWYNRFGLIEIAFERQIMDFMFIILKAFEWVLKDTNIGFWVIAGFACIVCALGFLKALVRNNSFTDNSDDQDDDDLLYSPSNSSVPGNIYHIDDE